ncbi:MAG: hypothetical protein LH606_06640 [Cytophagaceae bacterium]|nr:hypothetical protein [Cytophagaceae bacterium]
MTIPGTGQFKENDKLVILPKTGHSGIVLIFATVLSGILYIGGLVLSLISLINN